MGVRRPRKQATDQVKRVIKSLTLYLQEIHGGHQDELARSAGVSRRTVSRAATGARAVRRAVLARLATAAGVTPEDLDQLRTVTERIHARRAGQPTPQTAVRRDQDRAFQEAATALAEPLRAYLAHRFVAPQPRRAVPLEGEGATLLCALLASIPPAQCLDLVDEIEELQSAELAELLCIRSLEATAENADLAVDLAELAIRAATLAPPTEGRAAARVNAWAHLGNALRVKSDLVGAERALATTKHLWRQIGQGSAGLNEARLLGFEASLRRAQRRFGEAIELLRDALTKHCSAEKPFLLLNKSNLFREMGDFESALDTCHEVETLLQAGGEQRLLFIASFNIVDFLSVLERFAEADARFPEAWQLAEGVAGEIERVRLRWVAGRIAAGLGRVEEGLARLEEVRRDFEHREMSYEWALASLDLALLHLERGDNAEVQRLARTMARIFHDKDIHRETLAALTLFCRAAEQERATTELGRQVVRFLHAARHNPELRFAPAPDPR